MKLSLAVALTSCTGDECLTELDPVCAPLYEPTFQNVFDNTLKPSCGIGGVSCHASEGRQNGLALVEIEEAYQLLLAERVVPGDAACSLMMQRLESTDSAFQMPPGRQLSGPERCAIQLWIQNGALR